MSSTSFVPVSQSRTLPPAFTATSSPPGIGRNETTLRGIAGKGPRAGSSLKMTRSTSPSRTIVCVRPGASSTTRPNPG